MNNPQIQAANPDENQSQAQDQSSAKHTKQELEAIYAEADQADQEIFAEMRSNLLLIAGDHYTKKGSKFWSRIRDDRSLSSEQKLRLTKNHIQKIVKTYVNNIVTVAPGVAVGPLNEKELHDQKVAELGQSVWSDGKARHNLDEKVMDWVDDLVGIGEVHTKLRFDPNGGDFKGYEQATDDQENPVYTHALTGEDTPNAIDLDPMTDQMLQHQPKASNRAVFSGSLKFEPIYGFNILRSPTAKSMVESPYLVERKMVSVKEVLSMLPENDERRKAVQASSDQTYVVFESESGSYRNASEECLWKEFHFRKGVDYPNGYYYIMVGGEILFEGEHPFGIFPIVSEVFEKHQTAPRGRSPVKTMRPYQIEINRAASAIATHQVTLGDDKLIMYAGSKMSMGTQIPGVRGITVTGAPPTILPGRDGSQYLTYMQSQIEELYDVMMVNEMSVEANGQLDPYAMLFRSASQKQKFSRYTKRFENFLKRVCETYLELQKSYLSDDALVTVVGRREQVNIPEFKNTTKLDYLIKLEPQTEDIETKLGRQLMVNHLIQYTAGKLDKQDIGKLARLSPYANIQEGLSDLTLDYDNGTNLILALDRGQLPKPNMYDDKPYMVKRLTNRKRQADFQFMDPKVQGNYDQTIQAFEQMITQEQQQMKAAEADFIPSGGYLVVCDFYVSDPQDPNKVRRARLPYESIQWLVQRLEQQGSSLQNLQGLSQGNLSDMAGMSLNQSHSGAQAMDSGHASHMPSGHAMPPHGVVPNGLSNQQQPFHQFSHTNQQPGPSQPSSGSFNPSLIGASTSPS